MIKINLIEYFENTVFNNGIKTAVIEGEKKISFSELNDLAYINAQHISKALDWKKNKPIAVFLPKSIESVVANIAISYSGNFYMNLDVKSPDARLQNIVELIQPALIITNTQFFERIKSINKQALVLNIDDKIDDQIIKRDEILNTLCNLIDTDPFCIINTSGSTGTPKGVVLNHKSFIDFIEWSIDVFNFSENEIIGSLSPLVFDIYSYELCMLMAKGHTIVLIPDNLAAFPIKILDILKEQRVSFLFWVPTIMVNIANMDLLSQIILPDIRTIWFAGEVFPTKQFNYWKNKLSDVLFANLYGPIEITLDCTYFVVNRDVSDDEPLPIGIVCRNTNVIILNDKDELVNGSEEGELCVRGTSLAMGYYNNSEKTAAAFVQNPLNKSYPEIIYRTGDIVALNERNEIIFKGRKDSLIKHLGYRIELGEIEHVIVNTLKMAKNGCVVYNFNKKEITLFYESEIEISISEFRKQIAAILPKYMIPTVYVKMDELPRNTNGKIDRLELKNRVN